MNPNKIYFRSIPSTNLYIKENLEKLNHGDVVITKNQTNGYGRFHREWFSNQDEGIAFSILLKSQFGYEELGKVCIITAVSIINILEKYSKNLSIKWPNDILLNSKKLCGILIETMLCSHSLAIIIGIGININNKKFPIDLSKKATSLCLENNEVYEIDKICSDIIEEIYNNINNQDETYAIIFNKYKEKSVIINKEIIYNNKKYIAHEIDYNGSLVLINDNNERIVIESGEISLTNEY